LDITRTPFFPYTTLFRSFIRHVRSRILSRLSVGPHIGAHKSEVAAVSRPFEIIGIPAKEADVFRRRIYDANIIQYQVREFVIGQDRKSKRLNSSHEWISY